MLFERGIEMMFNIFFCVFGEVVYFSFLCYNIANFGGDGMKSQNDLPKTVIVHSTLETIPNIFDLKRIGAGHDGVVFQYNDKALKILKYDILIRREKNLMTFDKALYFQNELSLKRIIQPIDTLLDSEGVYSGYVMPLLDNLADDRRRNSPDYKSPGTFTCGDLFRTTYELEEDFSELTSKKVVAKDINRGSYIYTSSFLHLCDMDKYLSLLNSSTTLSIEDANKRALNFTIAKFLYYQMLEGNSFDKLQKKQLENWVKTNSNSRTFMGKLRAEIGGDELYPIGEYAREKAKTLIR